jgi:hypothetical protein
LIPPEYYPGGDNRLDLHTWEKRPHLLPFLHPNARAALQPQMDAASRMVNLVANGLRAGGRINLREQPQLFHKC